MLARTPPDNRNGLTPEFEVAPILALGDPTADERRRLAWTATGGRTTHYNAVLQVFAEGAGARVAWTIDLLPDALAPAVAAMQDQGLAVMKRTFELRAQPKHQ